jgi:hypothetical protein
VLEYEERNAIASGDPVARKQLMNRHIVHLANWLGMGLPMEDKSFRPYNQFPMIYLSWRIVDVILPPSLEILISLGVGELWRLSINVQRDCTLNEFFVGFIPSFLTETRIRHHPIKDFEYSGYYRYDLFSFYLLPKKHDELDEDIIEALVGDHPSRLSRGIHRVLWSGTGQDVPLSQFLTEDVLLLVTPCHSRVATPHRQLKAIMSSNTEDSPPGTTGAGPLGYHRLIDELVERLRHCPLTGGLSKKLRLALPRNGFLMDRDYTAD